MWESYLENLEGGKCTPRFSERVEIASSWYKSLETVDIYSEAFVKLRNQAASEQSNPNCNATAVQQQLLYPSKASESYRLHYSEIMRSAQKFVSHTEATSRYLRLK